MVCKLKGADNILYFKRAGDNLLLIVKNNEVIGYMYKVNGFIRLINDNTLSFEDIEYIYKYLKNIVGVI